MRQPKARIRKRIPIRRRFLQTVLLTTIISILSASVTGFVCIRWIRGATEDILTDELEMNLKQIIREKTSSVNAKLEHYKKYIEFVRDYIEGMYADEAGMRALGRMFYAPRDTMEYALTRGFASADLTEDALRDELLFYSNLEDVWAPIARENEDLITTIYLGTSSGLLVSYDRYSFLSFQPDGGELVYNYYVSEWYRRGMSEDGVFLSGVYMDSQGRGLTMTIASGFKDGGGKTAGVVCMDFDLSALYNELFATGLDNGAFIFALDHEATIISPESDTLDLRAYTGLTLDELDALRADADGIMEKGDSVYVCIPMERVGWTLCACVPRDVIQRSIHDSDRSIWSAVMVFLVIVLLILVAAVIAVNRSVRAITYPLELLGRDIKVISDGDLSYRASVYRNDEIGDITSGMNEMVDRLNFTLNELMSSQQHADAMSRLATLDALTGVRNKTAFDGQSELLAQALADGEKAFGFAMLDLNNLKLINDNYGHDKGDAAIKGLCAVICDVFTHSPVFRVGGDEFVVILQNEDYRNIDALAKRFTDRIRVLSADRSATPWDRVSAAIGYALYDEKLDTGVQSVLARADREMYICKKRMKKV